MVGVPVLLGWGSPAALSRPMPNKRVQATAYSVRCAPASSRA